MSRIGLTEILVILVVFVILFGYKKLPDLGKSLGRGLKNFKRSMHEPDEIDITPSSGLEKKNESVKKSDKE